MMAAESKSPPRSSRTRFRGLRASSLQRAGPESRPVSFQSFAPQRPTSAPCTMARDSDAPTSGIGVPMARHIRSHEYLGVSPLVRESLARDIEEDSEDESSAVESGDEADSEDGGAIGYGSSLEEGFEN